MQTGGPLLECDLDVLHIVEWVWPILQHPRPVPLPPGGLRLVRRGGDERRQLPEELRDVRVHHAQAAAAAPHARAELVQGRGFLVGCSCKVIRI